MAQSCCIIDANKQWPENFLNNDRNVHGVILNKTNFDTIGSCDQWVNDKIIDAFSRTVMENDCCKKLGIYIIDTMFISKSISDKHISSNWLKYAKKIKLNSKNIILFPCHYVNHYFIVVVLVREKVIIILDYLNASLQNVNEEIMNYILTFLQHALKNVNFNDFSIYVPRDISTLSTQNYVGGNYGVQCISWIHKLTSGCSCDVVRENVMDLFRIGVANALDSAVASKTTAKRWQEISKILEDKSYEKITVESIYQNVNKSEETPLNFKSTKLFIELISATARSGTRQQCQ